MAIWQYFFPSRYSKWSSRKWEHYTNYLLKTRQLLQVTMYITQNCMDYSQTKLILTLKPYTLDNKISALKKTLRWVSVKDKPVFKQIHIQCFYNLSWLNLQITLSQLRALIQSFLFHCILLLDIWTINSVFVTPSSEITICQPHWSMQQHSGALERPFLLLYKVEQVSDLENNLLYTQR